MPIYKGEEKVGKAMFSTNVLPTGYQQVEYIESDGSQFIDLGYTLSNNTNFIIKLASAEAIPSVIRRVFGGYISGDNRYELAINVNASGVFLNYGTGTYYSYYTTTPNEPFIVRKEDNTLYTPNASTSLDSGTFATDANAYLFATNRANTSKFVGRIYFMKIYDGSSLKTNLVPCYRKSDSVVGMYDTITDTFFVNSGTGSFTKGEDVNFDDNISDVAQYNVKKIYKGEELVFCGMPADYQPVEYIESSGTQYIDLGLKATEKDKMSVDFSVTQIGELWRLFGCRTASNTAAFIAGKYGATTNLIYAQFDNVGANILGDVGITSDTKTTVELSSNGLFVNGTQTRTYPNYTSFVTSENILLFGSSDAGSVRLSEAGIRIYSAKFWQDGTLVREMVPCYRKSDNTIGMYDATNDIFYTNAGTGTFIKGGDV